jgi:hypothetical protein
MGKSHKKSKNNTVTDRDKKKKNKKQGKKSEPTKEEEITSNVGEEEEEGKFAIVGEKESVEHQEEEKEENESKQHEEADVQAENGEEKQQEDGKTEAKANTKKKKKKKTKMPHDWKSLYPGFNPVPGTCLIPTKVPLSHHTFKQSDFIIQEFIDMQWEKSKRKIGMILDLTDVTRYYNQETDVPQGIKYHKIITRGHFGPPNEQKVKQFISLVDEFMKEQEESGELKYILVHCTHGLNRTGYFICEYLIQRMGFTVEQALKAFALGRGLAMYNPYFIDCLFKKHGQHETSQMFKEFKYPGFPAYSVKKYLALTKRRKLLQQRGIPFETFDFSKMKSIEDMSQFNSISLPDLSGKTRYPIEIPKPLRVYYVSKIKADSNALTSEEDEKEQLKNKLKQLKQEQLKQEKKKKLLLKRKVRKALKKERRELRKEQKKQKAENNKQKKNKSKNNKKRKSEKNKADPPSKKQKRE